MDTKKNNFVTFSQYPKPTTKILIFLLHFSIQKTKWTPKQKKFVTFSQYRNRQPKNKKVCYISLYKNQNRQKFVTFLYTQTPKKNRKIEKSKKHVYVTFSQYPNRQLKFGFFCYISLYKKQNGQPKKIILLHFLNTETTTKKYLFLLHFSIQTTKRTTKKNNFVTFSQYPDRHQHFYFFCYISLYKKENGHQKLFFLLHFLNTKIDNQNVYFFVTFLYTKSKTDNETHCFCYIFTIPKPKPKKKFFVIFLYTKTKTDQKNIVFVTFSQYLTQKLENTLFVTFSRFWYRQPKFGFFLLHFSIQKAKRTTQKIILLHFAQYRDHD